MTTDIIEIIRERLKMLRERELLCADECRALELLVEEIEQQYIKLPVDADGVPIKPGDECFFKSGDSYRGGIVSMVGNERVSFSDAYSYYADDCYHVKPETVEDIIAEAMSFACEPEAPYSKNSKYVKQFAERIRKAVER